MGRFPGWLVAASLLLCGVAAAQAPSLADGFEWGDTRAWSATSPRRCDLLDTLDRGLTPSRVLHVAVGGSDGGGDGSEAHPFATIGRAAGEATPGTAIVVHAGTYPGGSYIADLRGTEGAPIWIGGAPGEARPVVSGGGEGLHLVRAAWVVLHDLEVTGAASNGVNADDGGDYGDPLASHHLVFRGLSIHDVGGSGNQDCLKLSGIDDYQVVLSSFARCGGAGSGSGIDHVGCHHGLIARSSFREHSGNAVQSKGGSFDIEIRWNRFADAGERSLNLGGSTGFTYFRPPLSTTGPNAEARDLRVLANLFEGSNAPIAYVGCVGCVVADNTLIDPHTWILRILQETTTSPPYVFEACRDGEFANNLVSFERADLSTWVNIGPDTAPETFTFDHNLWYAWDNPAQSTPNLPVAETGGVYGLDPQLDGAFHVGSSSPAAGAGAAPARVTGDLDGVCYQQPPAVGAFAVPRRLAVTREAAHGGDWGLEVAVGSVCAAEDNLNLAAQVVAGSESFTACESIAAGDGFQVAPGGSAELTAGRRIALGKSFGVAVGGSFTAAVDGSLSRTAFLEDDSPAAQVVAGSESFTACESIAAGDGFQVAPGGSAELTAGRRIALGNSFGVAAGGSFTAAVDGSLSRTAFLEDDSPAAATGFAASFWLDLDGLTVPPIDQVELLVAVSEQSGWRFRVLARSGPTLVLEVRDDDDVIHATSAAPVGPGWSEVGVSWQAAGTASLQVDGGPALELSGLDTGVGRVDSVLLGAAGGLLEGTSGTLLLDDFTAWW